VLRLIAEGIDDLVDAKRQVAMGADPQFEDRVHRGLRGRAEREGYLQLSRTGPGHPEDLLFKALDVLLLLHELVLGDEEWELHLLMLDVQERPEDAVHEVPDPVAVGVPDIHALDRVAHVEDLRAFQDLPVPFTEIVRLRDDGQCFGLVLHGSGEKPRKDVKRKFSAEV